MGLIFFDQFSLLHFATGIILYFFNIKIITAIFLHTSFEILENTHLGMSLINKYFINDDYLNIWPGEKNYPDSLINIFSDSVFFIIGWFIAYKLDNVGYERGWFKKHINIIN